MTNSWVQRVIKPYAEKAKWKDPMQPCKWITDMFDKYIPSTIIEMKKAYSHVTPLSTMNFLTTMVNILEGCIKPENVNNKAEQIMFEMYFVFAMIW
jgi:dynein heavy chain